MGHGCVFQSLAQECAGGRKVIPDGAWLCLSVTGSGNEGGGLALTSAASRGCAIPHEVLMTGVGGGTGEWGPSCRTSVPMVRSPQACRGVRPVCIQTPKVGACLRSHPARPVGPLLSRSCSALPSTDGVCRWHHQLLGRGWGQEVAPMRGDRVWGTWVSWRGAEGAWACAQERRGPWNLQQVGRPRRTVGGRCWGPGQSRAVLARAGEAEKAPGQPRSGGWWGESREGAG